MTEQQRLRDAVTRFIQFSDLPDRERLLEKCRREEIDIPAYVVDALRKAPMERDYDLGTLPVRDSLFMLILESHPMPVALDYLVARLTEARQRFAPTHLTRFINILLRGGVIEYEGSDAVRLTEGGAELSGEIGSAIRRGANWLSPAGIVAVESGHYEL